VVIKRAHARPDKAAAKKSYEKTFARLRAVSYAALVISIVAIAIGAAGILMPHVTYVTTNTVNNGTLTGSASGAANVTLANIDQPLNQSELAVINGAHNQFFQTAGEMYLNHTLSDTVQATVLNVTPLVMGNKTSVVYLGSITCIFCGENRWAMALALSRFGNFTALYKGYSSIGDSDVRTLYWSRANYNASGVDTNSSYSSRYINFIAMESTAPIRGGFSIQPISQIQQDIYASSGANSSYGRAIAMIVSLNNFQGTPYTIWGRYQVSGADAIVFGNTTPSSASDLMIAQVSHARILSMLSNPTSQFARAEYAAADLYVAMLCASLNNTAQVCALPAIKGIEGANGYR